MFSPDQPDLEATPRVGVVGAGISGLAVARTLDERGAEVVVFESRSRVGGRLHGIQPAGATARLDLGATWFWPNEPRIQALLADLGVAVHPQHLDGDALYHEPDRSRRLDGNPLDVPSGRFSDSGAALTEALLATLPSATVRLDTPVQAIGHRGDRITIRHLGGELEVDHLVLALPPALASHRLTFDPPLPDEIARLAATTPVWMGAYAKVVVTFTHPFWRDLGLAGSAISHVGPMREIHDMSGPGGEPAALFGFVPLAHGAPTPDHDDIRRQLRTLFGADAPDPVSITIADWSAEPDTSPPNVRALTAYETFGHPAFQTPIDGRIHWSSTETSTIAPGHVEGALAAAERVADAILPPSVPTAPTPTPTASESDTP